MCWRKCAESLGFNHIHRLGSIAQGNFQQEAAFVCHLLVQASKHRKYLINSSPDSHLINLQCHDKSRGEMSYIPDCTRTALKEMFPELLVLRFSTIRFQGCICFPVAQYLIQPSEQELNKKPLFFHS